MTESQHQLLDRADELAAEVLEERRPSEAAFRLALVVRGLVKSFGSEPKVAQPPIGRLTEGIY